MTTTPVPEPSDRLTDPLTVLVQHLVFYRAALLTKLEGLSDEDLRTSRLPSGWAPLEMLKHLTYVERRWLEWGFGGEAVDEPWGDHDPRTGRWRISQGETLATLREALDRQAGISHRVVAGAALEDPAETGGRFDSNPPTLGWILAHLLQEYARHVGQLDVVRELIDGTTGE